MTDEDDDLSELWDELRPPQPAKPKPPPPKPKPFGGMPFPRRAHVGLLTETGHEVNAPSYARVPTLLRLNDAESVSAPSGSLTFDVISFPRAAEDWGVVVTLGFYQDDGEPLFYLDLAQPTNMRRGDDLRIDSPALGLSLDGVRPPT